MTDLRPSHSTCVECGQIVGTNDDCINCRRCSGKEKWTMPPSDYPPDQMRRDAKYMTEVVAPRLVDAGWHSVVHNIEDIAVKLKSLSDEYAVMNDVLSLMVFLEDKRQYIITPKCVQFIRTHHDASVSRTS